MEPVRVLHVVTLMNRGGLETMLMNYYRHIDRDKMQFDFLTHRNENGAYDKEILSLGGKIYHVPPIRPHSFLKYWSELMSFFSKHTEYKIVHSHINALSIFPLLAAKNANIKVRIAHSHTTNFDKGSLRLLRHISKKMIPSVATHYWGCSKAAVRFLFGSRIYESNSYTILNNAIESKNFVFNKEVRDTVCKTLGIENKFVIGHIGSFSYPKNHEFMIEVFNEIHKKEEASILMLVGDGENRTDIQNKVKHLGLEEHVLFMGIRADIPELLQAMDAFLFPSRFEGLGIVLIEAQTAGVPILAADMVPNEVAITDLVRFLSLNDSIEVWADTVLTFRGNIKKDSSKQVENSGYSVEHAAEILQNNYTSMI